MAHPRHGESRLPRRPAALVLAAALLAGCAAARPQPEPAPVRIYPLPRAEVEAAVRDVLAREFPGRRIFRLQGDAPGLYVEVTPPPSPDADPRARFVEARYVHRVLILPVAGRTAMGEAVQGYRVEVRGGGNVEDQAALNARLRERIHARLAALAAPVAATAARPRAEEPPAAVPAAPAAASDPVELLRRLKRLRDEGVITDEEFRRKKAEILERL
ncbi:SHOCT domain-containing protein [Inmirania thermothiophila]|uniref:Putative oligomerization/nucleic acid binding protein n=1 Tax=Inmirania thermothiophila TaxID=1750597 RepID=A0A3N1XXZ9_9GAMM|nr:SHOCT domain-containing protein [Inmirania thermothiophila]ROR29807.1 putative oligomerization/nucleic acid binding protein [Inmirania thermothiophila]